MDWLPLLTLVGGWAVAMIQQELRDRRLADRETRGRDAERRMRREDRRDEFQRETLLELQDAIVALGRLSIVVLNDDRRQAQQGTPWANVRTDPELDEQLRIANLTLSKLRERVIDDELRQAVKTFHDATSMVVFTRSEADVDRVQQRITQDGTAAQARLGQILRALY